jgi:hypothetical protein
MGAWEKFCELAGCEFHEMYSSGIYPIVADEEAGVKEVAWNPFVFKKLLYAGYYYGCKSYKTLLECDIDDMSIWMDEMSSEDFTVISQAVIAGLELTVLGKKKEVQKENP